MEIHQTRPQRSFWNFIVNFQAFFVEKVHSVINRACSYGIVEVKQMSIRNSGKIEVPQVIIRIL